MMAGSSASDDDVLDNVFNSGRDRGADSAAPDPVETLPKADAEPPVETPKADAEAPKGDVEGESPKGYRDPESGRFVPLHELKTERQKRQDEARLREAAETRVREYEQRIQDLERKFQTAQPKAAPVPPPDPWSDPEGALRHQAATFERQIFETRVLTSQQIMRSQKPDYDEAEAAFAKAAAEDPRLAQELVAHPFPAQFAYEHGKRLAAMAEIGADPTAYKAKLRAELREEVLAELKGTKAAPTAAPQRFPGTLADATGSGGQGALPQSDDQVLGEVFGTGRRRR